MNKYNDITELLLTSYWWHLTIFYLKFMIINTWIWNNWNLQKNLKQALFSNLFQVRVTNFLVDRRKAGSLDFYKQYKKLISYIF